MKQTTFKNQIDKWMAIRVVYHTTMALVCFYPLFYDSLWDFVFIMVFDLFLTLAREFDILRCSYRIDNGFLNITEYSFLFRKKKIQVPLHYIDKVEEKFSILKFPERRLHIYVGKSHYKLRAASCRQELKEALSNL